MNALHADGLGSVRAVTDGAGAVVERTTFRPFGEEVRLSQPLTLAETRGFIGERFDDGAGLQYLNARYYDPRLAMFIQPDWWEVTGPGVGTNRYSYSFNDPVNLADPGGNVPYNPGGTTSTGWTDQGNGVETYDSRTDRYSGDYLDQDGDGHHTIGRFDPSAPREFRTVERSGVNSQYADRDSQYSRAEMDALRISQAPTWARGLAFGGVLGQLLGPAVLGAVFPEIAAITGRAGLQTTLHGSQRIVGPTATRGGILTSERATEVMATGHKVTQANGLSVHVIEAETGRFDVVVSGSRGVVTTFNRLSRKSLERLADRYGWH